ncbi:MAG: AtpZ/AtpI family protein [Patescibacteria group bacterium]
MKQGVATRVKSTDVDEIERLAAMAVAKQQFVASAIDMGWRLALVVIIPVIIGTWLDNKFKSEPSYTLAALMIATGGVVWVVAVTIKQVQTKRGKK